MLETMLKVTYFLFEEFVSDSSRGKKKKKKGKGKANILFVVFVDCCFDSSLAKSL